MAEDHVEMDLGHLVGLWEIVDLPNEGRVFDLNEIDVSAIGKFGDAADDQQDKLELFAGRLPTGSYIAVFFPQEEGTHEPTDPSPRGPAE